VKAFRMDTLHFCTVQLLLVVSVERNLRYLLRAMMLLLLLLPPQSESGADPKDPRTSRRPQMPLGLNVSADIQLGARRHRNAV
jgi:hypothetical protein